MAVLRHPVRHVFVFGVLVALGCSQPEQPAEPIIAIQVDGVTIPNGTGAHQMEKMLVGFSAEAEITILNQGNALLSPTGIPKVSITGTGASQFSVGAMPEATIAAGDSTTFTVRFSPASSGAKQAEVNIASSDVDRSPYTFALDAEGAATGSAVIRLTRDTAGGSGLAAGSTVDLRGFPNVEKTFVIHNDSATEDLYLTGIPKVDIGGTDAACFALIARPSSPIPPGGTSGFSITYTPPAGAEQYREASVSIDANDPANDPFIYTAIASSVPSAPINLQISSSDSYVDLSWSAPATAGGTQILYYAIYRDNSYTGYVNWPTASVRDSLVTNDIVYHYWICAENANGEGPASNEEFGSPHPPAVLPTGPSNLIVAVGNASASLSWDPPASTGGAPVLYYYVYRGGAKIGSVTYEQPRAWNDASLTNDVEYSYEVSAKNAVGEGPKSTTVKGTPHAP